jgi:hypothetical protein
MVNQPSETDISGAMNAWKQGRCEFSLNLILILAYTDAAIMDRKFAFHGFLL